MKIEKEDAVPLAILLIVSALIIGILIYSFLSPDVIGVWNEMKGNTISGFVNESCPANYNLSFENRGLYYGAVNRYDEGDEIVTLYTIDKKCLDESDSERILVEESGEYLEEIFYCENDNQFIVHTTGVNAEDAYFLFNGEPCLPTEFPS